MPTPELMTWVPPRSDRPGGRWTRMHKGKAYWVSCRQLNAPNTKEGSILAANAWWRAKQAQIDAQGIRRPAPQESVLNTLFGIPDVRLTHDDYLELQRWLYPEPEDDVWERALEHPPKDLIHGAVMKWLYQLTHPDSG